MPLSIVFAAIWDKKYLLLLFSLITGVLVFILKGNEEKEYIAAAKMSTGITLSKISDLNGSEEVLQPFLIQNRFDNLISQMQSNQIFFLLGMSTLEHDLQYPNEAFRTPDDIVVNSDTLLGIIKRERFQLISMQGFLISKDIRSTLKEYKYDRGSLQKCISINRIGNSDYIEVVVKSEHPELSAWLANRLIDIFIKFYQDQTTYTSEKSNDFLSDLVAQKKEELDNKVNELKQFKLSNNVINLYEQTKTVVNQIKDQELKRVQIAQKIPALEKELSEIDSFFSLDDKVILAKQTKLLHQEILDARKEYFDEVHHSYNSTLSNDINNNVVTPANLKKAVKDATGYFLLRPHEIKTSLIERKLQHELELFMLREELVYIDQELDRLYQITNSFAPMEASIGALEREISVASEVYVVLLNKLNNEQFTTLQKGNQLALSEVAIVPDKPLSSKRLITVVLSSVSILFFGIALSIKWEYFDKRIKRSEEISWRFDIPSLGAYGGQNGLNHDQLCKRLKIFGNNSERYKLFAFGKAPINLNIASIEYLDFDSLVSLLSIKDQETPIIFSFEKNYRLSKEEEELVFKLGHMDYTIAGLLTDLPKS